jgi:hypothetical protein
MSFCSSAFSEMILLNRKILSENFRLEMQISRPARLLKIPLWGVIFKTHFSYRQRAQGRAGRLIFYKKRIDSL